MFKKGLLIIASFAILSASEYQDWLNSQNTQYASYKKSMDDEFSDMLKKEWSAFKAMSTPSLFKKPKPIAVPTLKKEIILKTEEIKTSPKIIAKPIKLKYPKQIKKIIAPKITNKFNQIDINFFGKQIPLNYDKNSFFKLSKIDKNSISNFWQHISKSEYKKLLTQIKDISNTLNLNNWAQYQLLYKIGMKIYNDKNTANLFTWFMLVKSNYDTKVGYNNNKIYLLSNINHALYQVSYFKLNNKKYYILDSSGKANSVGNIFTYKGDYPKAKNRFSFFMNQSIKLNNQTCNKELKFRFQEQDYKINVKYSNELINFYKSFPQSDYNIYFNNKNSFNLSNTLLKELQVLINGKTEIEAANMLLRFTQTAFKYKTDQKQFSYEKVMFPEETIFYPFSDCEDRSILFSYLIKNLLNLDVVGIKYKDHLATAVAFNSTISGDKFKYKNKFYTISDPTYINANCGMTMPNYKNSKFKIISKY
ncbi:MAG: hypothetical protein U9O56_06590 [Campylobacterota bacterium]|nr:hypothetical protein [Campylobacterota bacterium]